MVVSQRTNFKSAFNFGGVTTGELIATLEKSKLITSRKTFIELLGADATRLTLNKYLSAVESATADPDKHLSQVFFTGITKKDAFRTYSLFPRFIFPSVAKPDCNEELEELREASNLYVFSALWLLNWEKNSKYSVELGKLGVEEAEKRAWVSRNLYALCDYMKIHSDSPYLASLPAPAIWLLCEVSICKSRLEEKTSGESKRAKYQRLQKIYARLDSADPADKIEARKAENNADLARHFYGYFMYLVKKMAQEKPDFDEVLLKQYLKAQKTWGRKALSSKGTTAYL